MTQKKLVSSCCGAEYKIISSYDSRGIGTCHYKCLKCYKECERVEPKQKIIAVCIDCRRPVKSIFDNYCEKCNQLHNKPTIKSLKSEVDWLEKEHVKNTLSYVKFNMRIISELKKIVKDNCVNKSGLYDFYHIEEVVVKLVEKLV